MHSKLVRDNIPDIIRQSGKSVFVHQADEDEYVEKLFEKLKEECDEFIKSYDPEELADILEVVYTLGETQGITKEKLEHIRQKKRSISGGFMKKIILDV